MALYVMGDTHLSQSVPKPMDFFGGVWENYIDKLDASFSKLKPDDLLVIAGDISWGIDLDEALADFEFLAQYPFQKVILKGNHDLWWETMTKMKRFFEQHHLQGFEFLFNNSLLYQQIALCGTRGWSFEEEFQHTHDEKVYKRECIRLETSLKESVKLNAQERIVFLHYPPIGPNFCCHEMIDLMKEYNVQRCFYGHLHGHSHKKAIQGTVYGIEFRLISADYLNFTPYAVF